MRACVTLVSDNLKTIYFIITITAKVEDVLTQKKYEFVEDFILVENSF